MTRSRASELQAHIDQLRETIAAFERTTGQLRERRHGAADHVMVEIDERIALHERTLECLRRSLELANRELNRAGPGLA